MSSYKEKTFGRGVSTYRCGCCNGRTRIVSRDAASLDLCEQCYDLAGWDNQFNDDGTAPNGSQLCVFESMLAIIAARDGADAEAVKRSNPYIWEPAAAIVGPVQS